MNSRIVATAVVTASFWKRVIGGFGSLYLGILDATDSPQPARPFEDVLREYVAQARSEMASLHRDSAMLVDEIERLRAAGGKRLRPRLCYLGYLAGGG